MHLGKSIIFLILIFIFQKNLFANDFNSLKGDKISNQFKVNKKMVFPIEGEWEVIDKYSEYLFNGIKFEGVTFVQMENNIPVKFFEMYRATGLSKWQAYLTSAIESAVFNSKEGGCRERQHYNYLNVYKRGNAHNCMIVTVLDVQRVLNPSDYDPDRTWTQGIRKWVKENEIDLPKIYLSLESSFFSMAVRDEWYALGYSILPEKFSNYKPKFTSRDTTEFHPDKIKNFPEAKKIMLNWIKKSSAIHSEFELFLKAKKSQKLDLGDYVLNKPKKNKTNVQPLQNDISNELIKLNNLYKSGALTKEEFEKAKQKVLK